MTRTDWSARLPGVTHLVLVGLVAMAGAGCPGRAGPSAVVPVATAPFAGAGDPLPASEPHRIVHLVNLHRASIALRPLEFHPAVARVAQAHAEAIAAGREPFSHAGLEQRAAQVGLWIPHQAVGENLAAIPANRVTQMERAVERWILSDPHRETMEGCYHVAGVGVARTPQGVVYVTMLLVERAPADPSEARRGSEPELASCR